MSSRILILSVSAGAGHTRAAEALVAHARERYPGAMVRHEDMMNFVSSAFRKLYTEFYIKLIEHQPALWAYLYRTTDRMPRDALFAQVRRAVERLNSRQFVGLLREFSPTQIICTHFLPAELLSHQIRKGRVDTPVWVQVTDFDLHRMWVQPGMRGYFAANEEVAYRMREAGIAPNAIEVTGIPIMPAFATALSRDECAADLGLNPAKVTLLLTSGGAGLGSAEAMLDRLLKLDAAFQIIALAGRNAELLGAYQKFAAAQPGRVFPVGFTRTIERLMAAADIAITKPGGLTTSECLAMRLPMILIAPVPGQEERNADYLLEQGVALKAYDAAGLAFRVNELLNAPQRRQEMCARLVAVRRPHAAQAVLARVLG